MMQSYRSTSSTNLRGGNGNSGSPEKKSPIKRRMAPPKRKAKSEVEKLLKWGCGITPQETETLKNMVAACGKFEPQTKEEAPELEAFNNEADTRPARAAATAKKGQAQSKPKKSTTISRARPMNSRKDKIPKGRGRKTIMKKENVPKPIRAQPNDGALQFRKSIICQGVYFQTGDIVSVDDKDGGGPYYLQIQHLIVDEFFRECVELMWLVPKIPAVLSILSEGFVPKNFTLCATVPTVKRWLKDVRFVAHLSPDYYDEKQDRNLNYMFTDEGVVYIRADQSKGLVNFVVPDIPQIRHHNEMVEKSKSEERLEPSAMSANTA